ncbi:peptidase U32 family protein [Paenibacillus turpanensis]|uniref:peptidase U32 family protein n=1 Tax=Paenibacillus turpanensis TaxID=2689078 RepID=UPI00140925ED|nr:peptidase U32 family protein [Paenibacillus turpanensis]
MAVKKPKLIATAGSLEEARAMMDAGADELSVGDARYGLRVPGPMTAEQIAEVIQEAHRRQVRVVVSVNNIISNEDLDGVAEYLQGLAKAGADAIVFGDPAVLMAARTDAPSLELHWSAEMTSTNYASANYWGSKGAKRVLLARELNLEQIIDFKRHTDLEVQVQVHGITNIYHSKRKLVTSYQNHIDSEHAGEKEQLSAESGLVLVEHERRDQRYPVYEDLHGTHIMSSEDFCMLESLHELMEGGIDVFKVEGFMKSMEYNRVAVASYRKVIDAYTSDPAGYQFNEAWLEEIRKVQDPERELSFGFLYKEQVY